MFSVQQFREAIYNIFKALQTTGASVDIVYKGKVYEMLLIPTDRKPHLKRAKSRRSKKAELQHLPTEPCNQCESLKVAGVCMNTSCPSNTNS